MEEGQEMIDCQCNCGAVKFRVTRKPDSAYVCHCSICRRSSGANGVAVCIYANDEFEWVSGEEHIKHWTKPGHDWHKQFCDICGSFLPGVNDPERMFVPAGLFLGENQPPHVSNHILVDSRAPWDVIGDDGKQHPEHFTD